MDLLGNLFASLHVPWQTPSRGELVGLTVLASDRLPSSCSHVFGTRWDVFCTSALFMPGCSPSNIGVVVILFFDGEPAIAKDQLNKFKPPPDHYRTFYLGLVGLCDVNIRSTWLLPTVTVCTIIVLFFEFFIVNLLIDIRLPLSGHWWMQRRSWCLSHGYYWETAQVLPNEKHFNPRRSF